ncbi:MAG: glycosyltransferase family 2 protein [Desulfarculus sp.]|nr:MAG: glycosyltransferase family 2 protein [Desulfarculus sp.]
MAKTKSVVVPVDGASSTRSNLAIHIATAAILGGLALGGWYLGDEFLDALEETMIVLEDSPWLELARVSLVIAVFALAWRVYLAATYRPQEPCADGELPSITVVVPAYNEGAQVQKTIQSIAASDYPAERMQILAVDDGSRDDTWLWMERAAAGLPGRVELVRLAVNSGKRAALYAGFQRARGEILVTMDSDSEVLPQTLRHLVTPMVRDHLVGAVAGNVRVLNRTKGVIPRMLDVNFTFSFDFIRASQSRINTVMTTPGALSAYRFAVVKPLLAAWLHQRFLGRPANIGEDRSLTNFVLRSGYHAHFARKAVVLTEVPLEYRGMCRMFLRWARSNVRETLVMTSFLFRRFRSTPALGARVNLFIHLFRMTAGEWLKLGAVGVILAAPDVMAINLFMGAAIGGMLPALVYVWHRRDSNFLWSFPYMLLWMVGLSWISLWALLTPHKNGWLTRGLTSDRPSQAVPVKAVETEGSGISHG